MNIRSFHKYTTKLYFCIKHDNKNNSKTNMGSLLQLILPGAQYRILDDICVLHVGSIYAYRNGNHKNKVPITVFYLNILSYKVE